MICWGFKKLWMEITRAGQPFLLKGITQQKPKVVEGEPTSKVIESAAQLCLLQVREV